MWSQDYNGLLKRALATLIVVALAAAGCSSSDRPSVDEWQPQWERITNGLPDLAEVSDDEVHNLCTDTLAELRRSTPELSPTPDLAIDDVVTDWIRIAEDAFFECPPRSGEIQSFEQAYEELAELEAEVAVVLELES